MSSTRNKDNYDLQLYNINDLPSSETPMTNRDSFHLRILQLAVSCVPPVSAVQCNMLIETSLRKTGSVWGTGKETEWSCFGCSFWLGISITLAWWRSILRILFYFSLLWWFNWDRDCFSAWCSLNTFTIIYGELSLSLGCKIVVSKEHPTMRENRVFCTSRPICPPCPWKKRQRTLSQQAVTKTV